MSFIDKLLRHYEKSSFVIKYKARFLLYLAIAILVFIPVAIIYSIYIQLHDPVLNYSINWPVIIMETAGLIVITGVTVLLVRGHFFLSAHLTLSILTATVWAVMFIDHSNVISRLDTIVIVLGLFSAMPIFITREKFMVFVYAGINIGVLYAYMFYTRGIFTMPGGSFPDYLADNTISFLFIAIVSYNILSINNRALKQHEASNAALQKSNEEIQAAMEELTAANEEFEAQNEELARSEEALRASESELLAIFNGTYDAMIIHDIKGNILEVNDRMLEMYRVDRVRALASNIYDLVSPDSDIEAGKTIWDRVAEGEYALTDWKARRPADGSVFDAEVGLKRLMRRGSYVILAVVRDMTFRKEAEAALRESLNEKNFLIREIHHRVKNNMQIISSLLNMQSDAVAEPAANQALKDAMGRIHSMASIHERIYGTDNFSRIDMAAYIDELSRDLVQLYSRASGDIELTRHLKPVFMGIDRAIPCGLLINEILTNSIKHGCGGPEACRIDLGVEESGGWITIVIADYGPGMEPELFKAERKTSMGMQIIEALARQISATVTLEVNRGTRFTLRLSSDPQGGGQ